YAPDAIYFGIRAFEVHGNVVRATLADVVAIGEGRPHHVAVHLECADAEIDRVRRIEDEHLRRIRGRAAIHRPVLREAFEHRGLAPHIFIERAVQPYRGRLDAGNVHVDLTEAAVED